MLEGQFLCNPVVLVMSKLFLFYTINVLVIYLDVLSILYLNYEKLLLIFYF